MSRLQRVAIAGVDILIDLCRLLGRPLWMQLWLARLIFAIARLP